MIVVDPKKYKPDWNVLFEEVSPRVERLIEIYKENPLHARILYKQDQGSFQNKKVVTFTYENGDINIVFFIRNFGISVTNKMYSSDKNMCSILHKKDTNKWYFKSGNTFTLLTYDRVLHFISMSQSVHNKKDAIETQTYQFIMSKIPWLRNLQDDSFSFSLIGLLSTE